MARYDDLNTRTIGYLTFISSVLLVVTILLLQALCYNWIDWQEETKLTKQSYQSSDDVIQAQKASLQSYGKVQVEVPVEPPSNGAEGGNALAAPAAQMKTEERVHIPIDRAKALLLEELKSNASSGQSASAANT
jgi:hypothetical protein